MSTTARIRCKEGAFSTHTAYPNGKALDMVWSKENDFIAEVPTRVEYVDDFGQRKVVFENYAQHLLNRYEFLELVEVKKQEAVIQPEVVQAEGGEGATPKRRPGRPRKDINNEGL